MFTRLSQFTYGNYVIPNIDTVKINNNTALLIHIQKYEEEALRLAIGDCLYNEFISNLEIGTDGYYKVKEDAPEKWGWLLNGHTYDAPGDGCNSGKCNKNKWDGIVKNVAKIQDANVYESILAPYVFFKWSQNYRTINTGVGEGKGIAQGTLPESSSNKRVDAWNEFVQLVAFGHPNTRVSLYHFLGEHKSLFPDFQSVCFNTMTYWDI